MLVEINLLPKKERKSYMMLIIMALLAVIFIASAVFLYFSYSSYKKDIEKLDSELAVTREMIAIEQANAEAGLEMNSVQQLQDMIAWGTSYPIKTVPVLKELTALLPKRGFLLNYSYSGIDTVQLTVQFDTLREASSYLDELLASEWTAEVKMNSINATSSFKKSELDGSEAGASNDTLEMLNEDYVPRYQAFYEVKLNAAYINEQSQGEKAERSSSSEGVEDDEQSDE